MMRELRPHQVRALDMLKRSLLAGHRRVVLQAATGFGKTVVAAAIIEGARRKGNRVLFVVPALSLIDQSVASFKAEGIAEIGVMQGQHALTDWTQPIQVASVQTLARRQTPAADVVVIDECHRWFQFYATLFADPAFASKPIIGLSATPWTKGLGKHYDDLIVAATTAELIEAGFLAPFRVFAPSRPDLSGVRTVAGDYHEGDLSDAMQPLVADVVEQWLVRGEGRPTLCFAVDRAHAKHLQAQFSEADVPTDYVDAYTLPEERQAVQQRFATGRTKVVCNVGCLTTGVDWDVRCIILARPTKSEMLFVQIVGRGLRTAPGKADCLILDHSDTHQRLGFVTDIRHERLDGGRERIAGARDQDVPLPKECPSCSFLRPAKMATCPACGFKPERQCELVVEEGDLAEFVRGQRPAEPTHREKQRFYSMLVQIAEDRGYKSGWASNNFKDRFGHWPNGFVAAGVEPEPDVLAYVRSKLIRFAKRRAA